MTSAYWYSWNKRQFTKLTEKLFTHPQYMLWSSVSPYLLQDLKVKASLVAPAFGKHPSGRRQKYNTSVQSPNSPELCVFSFSPSTPSSSILGGDSLSWPVAQSTILCVITNGHVFSCLLPESWVGGSWKYKEGPCKQKPASLVEWELQWLDESRRFLVNLFPAHALWFSYTG